MKVLMLSDFYPPFMGGMEWHVFRLARELVARGHEVAVCTVGRKDLPPIESDKGVTVRRVEGLFQRIPLLYRDPRVRYPVPIQDPILTEHLREAVECERPDVVHSHGWILYSYLPIKTELGIPLLATLHDYGLICPKKTLAKDNLLCDKTFSNRCVSCGLESYSLAKSFCAYLGVKSNKKALRLVDRYIAVSMFVKESHCRHLGVCEKDIVVIPNFLETVTPDEEFREFNVFPEDFVLFVGDLTPHRGVDVLLKAHEELQTTTKLMLMVIKRPGHSRASTSNVIVIENAARTLVDAAYKRCRFVVVPPLFPDACPTVALEAMGRGKAILGSDIGGLRDIIEDGTTGILVSPNKPNELARSMKHLLANPDVCSRMGEKGYARFTKKFSSENVLPEIESQYKDILRSS